MTNYSRLATIVWLTDMATSEPGFRDGYTLEEDRKMAQNTLQLIEELEGIAGKETNAFIPLWQNGKAYCGQCGKRIPIKIGARYCHKCGRKIQWKV